MSPCNINYVHLTKMKIIYLQAKLSVRNDYFTTLFFCVLNRIIFFYLVHLFNTLDFIKCRKVWLEDHKGYHQVITILKHQNTASAPS